MVQQRIGITGGIGSGKTTVCKVLEAMGYPVYYSDEAGKRLMHEDVELIRAIKQEFGNTAYTGNRLDRAYLAGIIFNDLTKRDALNALVHPKVREDFSQWSHRQKTPLVFQESALLFETSGYKRMDKTILVTAPVDVRIKRLQQRDQSGIEAITARISNQLTDEEKIPLADFVIVNDDRQLVLPQVEKLINRLLNL